MHTKSVHNLAQGMWLEEVKEQHGGSCVRFQRHHTAGMFYFMVFSVHTHTEL